MYLFTFEKHGNQFNVIDTKHANEARDKGNHKRNKNYTNEKLHEILNLAAGRITQYRNKNNIAITFINDEGKTNSILCSLEDNNIILITMLEGVKRQVNDVFYGCNNIFLRGYIFVKPTYEETKVYNIKETKRPTRSKLNIKKKQGKTVQQVQKDLSQEDDLFTKYMKNLSKI